MIRLLSLVVFTLTLFGSGRVLAQPAGQAKLPDTDAGRCAAEFLAMLNDNTPESITRFETTWASKTRLSRMTMDERIKRMSALRSDWADAKLQSVSTAPDQPLVASFTLSNGSPAEFELQFSKVEPGKLDAVMLQVGSKDGATKLTPEFRTGTVEAAAKALREQYVYPEVGEKMAQAVLTKLKAGEYDAIDTESKLARQLTTDLREVSHDKHLGVGVFHDGGQSQASAPESGEARSQMRRDNYAFRKVEILPGNIGYVRFDAFIEDAEAKQTAASALGFLQHCDALVFDVRYNGGGSPEMIQFITSYLFDEPTHLNDMIDRQGKTVEEYWTLKEIPGKRFAKDLPVYVLCSSTTFSGAEEFCYNLKNLKRGVIVGETTGGGAHPVRGERLNEHFMIRVPFMRANNPISKTNWEGTGVEPDVKCSAADALEKALLLIKGTSAKADR